MITKTKGHRWGSGVGLPSRKCRGGTAGNVGEMANSCITFLTRQEMGAYEAGQVGKARPGRAWCRLTKDREPLGQKPGMILLDLHFHPLLGQLCGG